ncbi:MAG: DNA polymerase III subunit alpha [Phycisphaerales bacterium]|nr:DNA polymerase III subunit alpha [Phycisphaerales bacterium]
MPTAPAPSAPSSTSPPSLGGFAHLHLHTEFSLLDGGNRLDKLMDRCKELGMGAVACTDHGNMFGAVGFALAAKERGIKPILGVEAYVAPNSRHDRTYTGSGDGGFHLVLLAENDTGWKNLLYLASEAYLTGFYFKPRIDRELLAQHHSGLIAILGHLGSELGDLLLDFHNSGDRRLWERAIQCAQWHAQCFPDQGTGPRLFIELQHHVPEQVSINPLLIRVARELNLPLVCDNDAHFLREQDHDAHDTLVCISTGKGKFDNQRMRYSTELYVKSPQQMADLFAPYGADGQEALANTIRIAERCNVNIGLGANHAPLVSIAVPAQQSLPRHDEPRFGGDLTAWYTAFCAAFEVQPLAIGDGDPEAARAAAKADCDASLKMLAEAGFRWRYGPAAWTSTAPADIAKRERLARELKILADKSISAYFLIVWDFVNWGRQQGIPAIARGSGVGTMVGYVLGLSNACPVQYGLLFERFTDPDRSEYPDIDIDLCQDGRGDVINYVRRKYGHVAQIITFGTLKARAAIRDVGRVLEMPLPEVDKVAKLVPEQLGMTLDQALTEAPDLKALYDRDATVRRCIDNARALEGQARHASVHAAGVIVATRPLHEVVPLYRPSGTDDIVTQWDGPTCEKVGLLKMDFLGLRTLSVIERCKKLINDGLGEEELWRAVGRSDDYRLYTAVREGKAPPGTLPPAHPLDLDRLSFTDQRVFEMFRRGDTTGVFQFESPGMRRLLMEMKPDRLEDLIAANALFRPGPMDLIPDYNRRKHGQEAVPEVHPVVTQYTSETYGVMVYQEQVMQIVHGLGGIPLRAAYSLIKAISKKKEKVINAERPRFVEGAAKQGLPKPKAEELFELILKFAGYGFNKSHSTGYAIVAYQTAYLKTFFPNQYMAAFLTYESGASQVADWVPYLEDCKNTRFIDPATGQTIRTGVEVKPPDVNRSQAAFAVVFEPGESRSAHTGHVRFGLSGIKGVGDKAIEHILNRRDAAPAPAPPLALAGSAPAVAPAGPYSSLFGFCERVPIGGSGGNGGSVNKATLEALIKSGAMDCLHGREGRAAMLASLESAIAAGVRVQADKASGQSSLFGFGAPADNAPAGTGGEAAVLTKTKPWTEQETLASEKEALGFYISRHPLDQHADLAKRFANATTRALREGRIIQDARVVLPALVQSIRAIVLKNGQSAGKKMAVLQLEDKEGVIEAVAFAEVFAKHEADIATDRILFAIGKCDLKRGTPQVVLDRVVPIEHAEAQLARRMRLVFDENRLNGHAEATMDHVAGLLRQNIAPPPPPAPTGADKYRRHSQPEAPPGLTVEVVVLTPAAEVFLDAQRLRVLPSPELLQNLHRVLGPECVQMVAG